MNCNRGEEMKIGDEIKIKIDRPIGNYHPEYKDMYYPVNYGYVEVIIAPDGEEQDVYLLGLDHPVDEFTGRIIAIIKRNNDIEDKWVAAPEEISFTKEEIWEKVLFQEQYFDSEIIMG